jgi:hypothetical protein
MALVLEDGTGLANSNAYADVAWADAFATDRNQDAWMRQSATLKAKFLVQASDYIDKNYRFLGARTYRTQAMEFPRRGVPIPSGYAAFYDEIVEGFYFPSTVVPDQVKKACCEYAFRAAELNESNLDLQPDPAENFTGTIIAKTEKVGSLEDSTKWSGATPPVMPQYPAADRWLRDFKTSGNPIGRA